MSEHINHLKSKLISISKELQEFQTSLQTISQQEKDRMNEEERAIYFHLMNVETEHVSPLVKDVEYLNKKIIAEGPLHLNDNGKFELKGMELSHGQAVEIFLDHHKDQFKHTYYVTHLEYAGQYGGGYFAFHFPNLRLEGVKARVRE